MALRNGANLERSPSSRQSSDATARTQPSSSVRRCRRKFLRFFPKGFLDPKYIDWERGYKWKAHQQWIECLNRRAHRALLQENQFEEIAGRAVRVESRTNLLFSFEKMALRDSVRSTTGAQLFAEELYEFLYGRGSASRKFERWCNAIEALPRKQTRVLTWPLVTIFGFIAQPEEHIFLKPIVTQIAAQQYGYDFQYGPRPSWATYASLLDFALKIRRDLSDMPPRDMIDIQSFIWVQGSDEYDE